MTGSTGELDIELDIDLDNELDIEPETGMTVTFEACVEHRGDDADGPCARCGWLAVEHTAGLAVVIEVGRTRVPALRKAS